MYSLLEAHWYVIKFTQVSFHILPCSMLYSFCTGFVSLSEQFVVILQTVILWGFAFAFMCEIESLKCPFF